jgi:hypothetical protein
VRHTFLRHVNADFLATEQEIQVSDLDWTIFRPPSLTNKPTRGTYRVLRADVPGRARRAVRLVQVDADEAGDAGEVGVAGQERRLLAPGDGGDQAVDQATGSDAGLAAAAVDAGGGVEVSDRVELAQAESQQEAAQVGFSGVAAGSGQDFHDHRLGDGDRTIGRDQL